VLAVSRLREVARRLPAPAKRLIWRARVAYGWVVNPLRVARLRQARGVRLHVGCGDDRLPGFCNVDCRVTRATDCLIDLNSPRMLPAGGIACCFSHAFFEHLRRDHRAAHLRHIFDALDARVGVCCYIGLPYFPAVARLYLEKGPGVVGPTFDLFNVYRYTHGDPDRVPFMWYEQLHKSLFDEQELSALLGAAGFRSFALFQYCYTGEEGRPVSCGFFATKSPLAEADLRRQCLAFLTANASQKVILDTVRWL
jgi:hypothetical protein